MNKTAVSCRKTVPFKKEHFCAKTERHQKHIYKTKMPLIFTQRLQVKNYLREKILCVQSLNIPTNRLENLVLIAPPSPLHPFTPSFTLDAPSRNHTAQPAQSCRQHNPQSPRVVPFDWKASSANRAPQSKRESPKAVYLGQGIMMQIKLARKGVSSNM